MAILNVTPDSFSDGGRFQARDAALRRAEAILAEGAHIIDIGGESTRPGAPPLSLGEELDRVIPVVEALRDCGMALSIDTYKPEVMRAALAAGADMINDIRGFAEDGALEAVAESDCGICVMHMRGDPRTMQATPPVYDDVVAEVREFLDNRVIALESAGVARERIVVDPGFGFGKTVAQNFRLLRDLPMTSPGGLPILVGMSRKSMVAAAIAGAPKARDVLASARWAGHRDVGNVQDEQAAPLPGPGERLFGSLAAAVSAAERGAAIVRVHDVAQTAEALAVWLAINPDMADQADDRANGPLSRQQDGRNQETTGGAVTDRSEIQDSAER